jgi:hypothetical protein
VWKSAERFSTQPGIGSFPVHRICAIVNFCAPLGRQERFTSFLITNVLGKRLTSTETIAKLVEKSVQIPV